MKTNELHPAALKNELLCIIRKPLYHMPVCSPSFSQGFKLRLLFMRKSWRDIKSCNNSPRPSVGESRYIQNEWKTYSRPNIEAGVQRIHTQQSARTCHCKTQHSHNRKGICVHKSSNYIPNYPSAYAITQSVAQKSRFLQVFLYHLSFKIQLPFMSPNLGTYQSPNWMFVALWWRSSVMFSHTEFTHRRFCNLMRLSLPITT